jgi:hypothetical protein
MGKGSQPVGKAVVAEYRLGMHYGLVHGPVDALEAIYVNDKTVWSGSVTDATLTVSNRELFGGNKKEGGVEGRIVVMNGGDSQLMSSEIAAKFGGSPATVPGFRGFMSVFFMGLAGQRPGFLWSFNTPYIKPASFKIKRMPRGLGGGLQQIGNDANPSHIIYECLTNTVWGMGGSPGQIDTNAFLYAAQTLYNEGFGMSLMWTGQSTIQSFVQEVLDHIEATFFLNPQTGLLQLKLIRNDYDVNSLFSISPENARLTNFQRKSWGETVNEINASWTNPENEQDETVTVHDLGNIASQGALVSSTRNYYGARNASLALRMATRDLNAAAFPVASCEADVDRAGWKMVPGDVVKVSWPEHGVTDLVMRVGGVRYGKPGDPRVRVNLLEDVFAMPENPYVTPPTTGWVDPSNAPAPMAQTSIGDASYYAIARLVGDANVAALPYPQGYTRILMAQNDADTYEVNVLAEGADAGGNVDFRSIGTRVLSGRAVTSSALVAEVRSLLPGFTNYSGKVGPDTGFFVQIGGADDEDNEIALIESQGVDGPMLRRGVLDTIPRDWPAGTPIWFYNPAATVYDTTARAATQLARYKLLTRTSLGLLDPALAPIQAYTMGDRLHRPYRPANVRVNGVLFPTATSFWGVWTGLDFSWANRNRAGETSQILAWDDGSVTPEDGQTTRLTLRNSNGSLLYQQTGLTGTSHSVSINPWDITGGSIEYTLEAELDGLLSLQPVTGTLSFTGYGFNYGRNYGGV